MTDIKEIKEMANRLMKGMPTNNKLKLFFEMRESIFADFGYEVDPAGELRGYLGVWWIGDSYSVKFGHTTSPQDDIESEMYYGNEIIRGQVRRSDTHTLMFVDNGCGEQYWQIFLNSNEVTQADYEEAEQED